LHSVRQASNEVCTWEKNAVWLDDLIYRGFDVVFTGGNFNPLLLEPGTALAREIEYLLDYGYEWVDGFTRLVKH
jgi:hypothetical protein